MALKSSPERETAEDALFIDCGIFISLKKHITFFRTVFTTPIVSINYVFGIRHVKPTPIRGRKKVEKSYTERNSFSKKALFMQWVRGWDRGCGNLSMTIMAWTPPLQPPSAFLRLVKHTNTPKLRNEKALSVNYWCGRNVWLTEQGASWRWRLLNNLIFPLFSSHKFGHP